MNGSIDMRSNLTSSARGPDANSSSSSADGQELEEERRIIRELLSKMQLPKVKKKKSKEIAVILFYLDITAINVYLENNYFVHYKMFLVNGQPSYRDTNNIHVDVGVFQFTIKKRKKEKEKYRRKKSVRKRGRHSLIESRFLL